MWQANYTGKIGNFAVTSPVGSLTEIKQGMKAENTIMKGDITKLV